ncbi:hypothetical protein V5O48_016418 [Marasmius crinis-equi]|uniref:Uncharacterized protein n=1 Tax=Marasmius crinis-equi TaxID=585013 RepID=A0ABR3ERQ9_9AGAR
MSSDSMVNAAFRAPSTTDPRVRFQDVRSGCDPKAVGGPVAANRGQGPEPANVLAAALVKSQHEKIAQLKADRVENAKKLASKTGEVENLRRELARKEEELGKKNDELTRAKRELDVTRIQEEVTKFNDQLTTRKLGEITQRLEDMTQRKVEIEVDNTLKDSDIAFLARMGVRLVDGNIARLSSSFCSLLGSAEYELKNACTLMASFSRTPTIVGPATEIMNRRTILEAMSRAKESVNDLGAFFVKACDASRSITGIVHDENANVKRLRQMYRGFKVGLSNIPPVAIGGVNVRINNPRATILLKAPAIGEFSAVAAEETMHPVVVDL